MGQQESLGVASPQPLLTSLEGSQIWNGVEWEVGHLELDDLYAPHLSLDTYTFPDREKFVLEKT